MLIAFVHSGKAFLPGMEAYSDFFSHRGVDTCMVLKRELRKRQPDIEWHFMGTHFKRDFSSSVIIHEYASASIPPFSGLKDAVKRHLNITPDFRIFLNEYVRDKLRLAGSIPYGFRDLGLRDEFITAPAEFKNVNKEYDFVYSGSASGDLKLHKLLNHFKKVLKEKSILVLSRNYDELAAKYKMQPNIFFNGPVEQRRVPEFLSKARFAINFKPNIEPHNRQTVTKLMEYAACRVPVITSDLAWVREFQQQRGGEYFYLKEDLSNFTWENINRFKYTFPDLTKLTWEHQIRSSGILDFLASRFPGTDWS